MRPKSEKGFTKTRNAAIILARWSIMYCADCGKELSTGAEVCGGCGHPLAAKPEARDTSPHHGLVALVLGIASWPLLLSSFLPFGVALGAAAVGVGAVGLRSRGRGMAIAGIVIGGLCVLALPLFLILRRIFFVLH
jgi:hypothetical protein